MTDQHNEDPNKDAAPDNDQDQDKNKDEGKDGGKDDKEGKDGKDGKEKASPEKRRKIKIILAIGAVVVLLVAGAWFTYYELTGKYHQETDDAYIQADAVTVSPKVGGYVEQVLVRDNQDVQAGQPLVRIDPRDYRAQTEQYQAQIDIARANADAVRAQIAEQESAVAGQRAQLAAALKNAAYAAGEARRYAPLVEIGAENGQALADRRNQAAQAAEQVATQRAALANAEKRIASLRAQVRQAEAQGEVAAAQLKAAGINLQSATLTASVAGRVGDSTVRVGQFAQPGTRLMTVVPLSTMYIEANFKETQIGRMRIGQLAEIKVDALPGLKLRGRVESLSPGTGAQFSLLPPQNATGNFTKIVQRVPVRIALDATAETRERLLPGLSVKVTIYTKENKDAIKDLKQDEKDHAKQEDPQHAGVQQAPVQEPRQQQPGQPGQSDQPRTGAQNGGGR
jgi:membrane fusion protein (multidrug efflux system)